MASDTVWHVVMLLYDTFANVISVASLSCQESSSSHRKEPKKKSQSKIRGQSIGQNVIWKVIDFIQQIADALEKVCNCGQVFTYVAPG